MVITDTDENTAQKIYGVCSFGALVSMYKFHSVNDFRCGNLDKLHDIQLYDVPRAPRIVQQLIFILKDDSVLEQDVYFFRIRNKKQFILRSHILDMLFGHHLSCISFILGWQMWIHKYFTYAIRGILRT
jgi:hypothetical protein